MSKKLLSGIIATALTASTVATSVIPMTNYKPHNENLVANTTDVVETKKLSNLDARSAMVYDGIKKINATDQCNPGELYIARIYDSGSYGNCNYENLNKLRSNGDIVVHQTKMLSDTTEYNRVLNAYGIEATSKLKSDLQYSSFRGSGYYYTVIFKYNMPRTAQSAFSRIGVEGYWKLERLDVQKPTITGTNNFIVNVNNMLSKEDILSHISARDETDGEVPVVIDSSTYDPANKKLGDYEMVVSASDKAGNKTTITINVKVVDINKPTISGTNSYTTSYNKPISLDTIKGALTVTDNYDKGLQVQMIQDNYTSNTDKVGVHTVTFKAVDSSNNESDVFTVSITVTDKDKPVITGPATITVPSNKVFTLEEFKSKFTINDALDGDITLTDGMITGFDNYLQNSKKVGSYTVTINVADKNGNNATLSVTIKVEDKISPEIWFDDYFIVLEQGQALTPEQIKEYASKALGVSLDAITEVTGEYDTNVAGTYKLSVKTVDGKEHVINLSVTEKVVENTREMKWYEYIYEWFLILFNIEPEYKTDSFWNFGTRWESLVKVYTEHKILDNKLIK